MKNLVFFVAALLSLVSCRITREDCIQRYPDLVPMISSVDTIWKHDSTVTYIKDTVFKIEIRDSMIEQIIKVPWFIPSQYTTDTSHLVAKWCESYAIYDQNGLFHRLVPRDTILEIRLDSAIQRIEYYRELVHKSEKEKIYKESFPWWRKAITEVHGLFTGILISLILALFLFMKYGASFSQNK